MSGRNYGYGGGGGNYSSNYDRDRGGGRDRDNFKPRGYHPYGNRGDYNRDRGGRGVDDRFGRGSGFSRGGGGGGDNSYTRRDNYFGGRYQNNSAESRGYAGSGWSSGPRTSNNSYSSSVDSYGASTSTSSSASSYDMWVRRSGSGPGVPESSSSVKTDTYAKPIIPKDIEEKVLQAVSDVKMEGIFDKIRNQCINDSSRTMAYMNIEDKIVTKTEEYLKRVPWTKHLQQRVFRDRLKSYLMETKFFKDCMDRLVQDSLSDMARDSVRPIFTKAIEDFLGFERCKRLASAEGSISSDTTSENKTNKRDEESSESPSSSVHQFPPLPPSIQPPLTLPPPSSGLPMLFTSKILIDYDHKFADKEKNIVDYNQYVLQQQQEKQKKKEEDENQVPLISSSEKHEPVDCISLPIDMEISDYEDDDIEESNDRPIKANEIGDTKPDQEVEKRKVESYIEDDDDVNITPPYSPIEYDIQEKEEIIEKVEFIQQELKQEEGVEQQELKQEEGVEQQEMEQQSEMQEKEEMDQQQEMENEEMQEKVEMEQQQEMQEKVEMEQQQEMQEKEEMDQQQEMENEEMQEKEEIEQQPEMKEKEDQKDSIIEPVLYLVPLPLLRAKLKFFARFKKNDSFERYNVQNVSFEDKDDNNDKVVEEKRH